MISRGNHAPERAEPADDHDDEGGGDDLLSHRRMDGEDRRQHHAGEPANPYREGHRRHVRLERDAERTRHVRVLHAGTHHAAERGLLQKQPKPRDAGDSRGDDDDAMIGIERSANEGAMAAPAGIGWDGGAAPKIMRSACSATMPSLNVINSREIRRQLVEAAEQQPLDDDAEDADSDGRHQRRPRSRASVPAPQRGRHPARRRRRGRD